MQRKHIYSVVLVLGVLIAVALFMVQRIHPVQTTVAETVDDSTNQSQPMLFVTSLSDEAKLHNYFEPSLLIAASQVPNYRVITVAASQRCSAQFAILNHEAIDLPQGVLAVAMKAYHHAVSLGLDPRHLLTIVDYQKPSSQRRLWVFDLNTDKILYDTFVSHGAHSGTLYAKYFSNDVDSYQSSLGVILTGQPYDGVEGYSLRLHGLEAGFNSNIFKRSVVMHPASYVTRAFILKNHEAGKSFGCLAISRNIASDLINTIKDGTIIVNYFPNKQWLYHSSFLH